MDKSERRLRLLFTGLYFMTALFDIFMATRASNTFSIVIDFVCAGWMIFLAMDQLDEIFERMRKK